MKKSCFFRSTSKDGKSLYGTAVFLRLSSQNGGIDNLLKKIAADAFQSGVEQATKMILSKFSSEIRS